MWKKDTKAGGRQLRKKNGLREQERAKEKTMRPVFLYKLIDILIYTNEKERNM